MSRNKPQPQKDVAATEQPQPVRAGSAFIRVSDKHEVMLKPNWPGSFRRTIKVGDQAKVLEFKPGDPVEITADELKALKPDIGIAIFEIERDEKGRPRFLLDESVDTEVAPDPSRQKQEMDLEPGANAENV